MNRAKETFKHFPPTDNQGGQEIKKKELPTPFENFNRGLELQIKKTLEKHPKLYEFYNRNLERLPEYTVTEEENMFGAKNGVHIQPLTAEGNITTSTEELNNISNGRHFRFATIDNKKTLPDGTVVQEWKQLALIYGTEIIKMRIGGEIIDMPISGIIFTIVDSDGRLLVTLDQGPTANTPKKALIRPMQASMEKFDKLGTGETEEDKEKNRQLDPTLYEVRPHLLHEGMTSLQDYILAEPSKVKLLSSIDEGRMQTWNIGLVFQIETTSEIHKKLELDGINIWATQKDLQIFDNAQVLNGHGRTAKGHAEEWIKKSKSKRKTQRR